MTENIQKIKKNEIEILKRANKLERINEQIQKQNFESNNKICYYRSLVEKSFNKDKDIFKLIRSIKQKYNSILIFFIQLKEVIIFF